MGRLGFVIASSLTLLLCASGCGRAGHALLLHVDRGGLPVPATLEVFVSIALEGGSMLVANAPEVLEGEVFFENEPDSNRILIMGTETTVSYSVEVTAFDSLSAWVGSASTVEPAQRGLQMATIVLLGSDDLDSGPIGEDSGLADAGPDGGHDSGTDSGLTLPPTVCPTAAPARLLWVTVTDDELDDPAAQNVTDAGGPGDVSLREALTIANNNASGAFAYTILFDPTVFPVGGTAAPIDVSLGGAELPPIGSNICIDGVGADVVLRGDALGVGTTLDGLRISGDSSTIANLTLMAFPNDGIELLGGTGNLVRDCRVGWDGTNVAGVGDNGIQITQPATGNTIGPGNIVGGSASSAILIHNMATLNTVVGNYVGVTPVMDPIPNLDYGIEVDNGASLNVLDGNFVGFSALTGIYIHGGGTAGNEIVSSFIGVSPGGADIGNGSRGIHIGDGVTSTSVSANVIANNGSEGILLNGMTAVLNTFSWNLIYDNDGGAMTFTNMPNSGIQPPGISDVDMAMTSATGTSTIIVTGEIELFAASSAGDAECYLGSGMTDGAGNWTVVILFAPCGNQYIATVTDMAGNSSALSAPFSGP